jgi:L-rhamnose mutarotase
MDDFTKDKLKGIRKSMEQAHKEYEKKMSEVWEELSKLIKYG